MELTARAKINLGLRINGLRPDGYHEIWSVMQEIGLADTILLKEAPNFSLTMTCDQANLPADETNLCLKAARLLQQEVGCQRGVHMELTKRIPVGAGLGGGSSDAAAVLKGLDRFWELKLDKSELLELAGRLGSDVPFFILGGCCLATGRGEILQEIASPVSGPMVLAIPNVHVSTAWAYKNIEDYPLTLREELIKLQVCFSKDLSQGPFKSLFSNDFEPLVFAHYPVLRQLKENLEQSGAWYASMSGSGSAVYGLYQDEETARQALAHVAFTGRTYYIQL
jgi:4-diphosphocytidyl-2-C-methyl-D-erythritol kinase